MADAAGLPEELGAALGPLFEQALVGRFSVMVGSQPARPFAFLCRRQAGLDDVPAESSSAPSPLCFASHA